MIEMPGSGDAVKPQWQIRPYRNGDETQLLALFERTFGKSRTIEDWRWKFADRSAPFPHIWVAELPESGRLVGHYAGIPVQLKLGQRQVNALVSVETMTDPAYRRQGMLTRFGEVVYREWAASGQSLIIGLPNQQWGSRKDALGWVPMFSLSWLRFPLRPEKLIERQGSRSKVVALLAQFPLRIGGAFWLARARVMRYLRSSQISVHPFSGDSRVFTDIWKHAGPTWGNCIVRDESWVRWRFAARTSSYEIIIAWRGQTPVGYAAFRLAGPTQRTNGHIADIFAARGDLAVVNCLAVSALEAITRGGGGLAYTLAVPGTDLYKTLRKLGFFATPREHSFSYEAVPLDPSVTLDTVGTANVWHAAGGDSDVI